MKLRSWWLDGCVLGLAACIACDAGQNLDSEARDDSGGSGNFEQADEHPPGLDGVRARADAAFAEAIGRETERFETRIGPQPWPEDLPADWPRPSGSRVVADTRRNDGDRLLLVDLPDSPDRAVDAYRRALRGGGYEVAEGRTHTSERVLRATREGEEAMLSFVGRDQSTRLEIVFVARPRG